MFCVLVLPWLFMSCLFLFKGERAQGQYKCGFTVWEPRVSTPWMKWLLLIDVTLPQKSRISGFDPCIAAAYDSVQPFPICFCKALTTLVFVSGDQKLPLWYHLSLEGIGLATIHCQKTIWHWGLLNITTYWIYWFYVFFSLYGVTFQLLDPLGLRLLCYFLIFPLKNSAPRIWPFSFHRS